MTTKFAIAAAVASMCAAVSFAEVTSANCVGYSNNTITNGNQGVGGAFMAIGRGGKMSDLTVSGPGIDAVKAQNEGNYWNQGISCGLLDKYGLSLKRMYWYDITGAIYGWYDSTGMAADYNDDPIEPGQGLWFASDIDGVTLNSSGEVIMDGYAVTLTNGNQLVSNPLPVDIKMGQIGISGPEIDKIKEQNGGNYWNQGISCGLFDKYGVSISRMYWYDIVDAIYGWYDSTGMAADYNNDILKAGQALWTASDVECQMVFPAIEAK